MVTVGEDPWFRLVSPSCSCGITAAADNPFRRKPTATELRAGTDFALMNTAWADAVNGAVKALEPLRAQQIRQLTDQVRKASSTGLDALDTLALDDSKMAEALIPHLIRVAQSSAEEQQREAESQGVSVPPWTLTVVATSKTYHGPKYSAMDDAQSLTAAIGTDLLRSVARVTARLMSTSLVQSAIRKALSLVGRSALTATQVANEVRGFLESLTDAGPREAVGGAITAAQNEGRRTVLAVAPPADAYVSSEILDRNVCGPCREEDGTEYATLREVLRAYPAGGFVNCLGGTRCRGTYVATWGE